MDRYEEIHPIDIVETLAEKYAWEFNRVADDQIVMTIEGQWKTYSITLVWSSGDETLRLICTYELTPPENKLSNLYEILNIINDKFWTGSFTFWEQQNLLLYRYGLLLTGGEVAGEQQINKIVELAVSRCEQFYPPVQLVCWGEDTPKQAMKTAFATGNVLQ